jgi:hypothetical protein
MERGLFREIVVIANEPPKMPVGFHTELRTNYGHYFNPIVKVINAHQLTPDYPTESSWFSQQALKLLVARFVTSDYYMVIDAKNHLVFPFSRKDLEANGKPRNYYQGYVPRVGHVHSLLPYLEASANYFGLNPRKFIPKFVPTTTPFVIPTRIAREMMERVEWQENCSFAEAFLNMRPRLSEFFMLGAYIARDQLLEDVYDMSADKYTIIWKEDPSDEHVRQEIARTEKEKLPFFAIHRSALPLLKHGTRNRIADFWVRRGLFHTRKAAIANLEPQYEMAR